MEGIDCRYSATCHHDYETGRCRLSIEAMMKYKLTIGMIIQIKIMSFDKISILGNILCTVWPFKQSYGEDDFITFDSKVKNFDDIPQNITYYCEIVKSYTSTPCRSLQLSPNMAKVSKFTILSLPVMNGYKITYHNTLTHHIIQVQSSICALCTPNTIITFMKSSCDNPASYPLSPPPYSYSPSSSSSSTKSSVQQQESIQSTTINTTNTTAIDSSLPPSHISNSSVNTRLVQELIQRIIMPLETSTPKALQYHGILLLGPPGTGKTFSVQAMRSSCINTHQINIYDLNIPELLSMDDPISYLKEFFHKAKISVQDRTNSSQPYTAITNMLHSTVTSPSSSSSKVTTPITPISDIKIKKSTTTTPKTPIIYKRPTTSLLSSSTPSVSIISPQNNLNDTATPVTIPSKDTEILSAEVITPRKNTVTSSNLVTSPPQRNESKSTNSTPYSFHSMLDKCKTPTPKKTPSIISPSSNSSISHKGQEVYSSDFNIVTYHPECKPEISLIIIDEIDALGKDTMQQSEKQIGIISFLCSWFDNQSLPQLNTNTTTTSTNMSSLSSSSSSSTVSIPCCLLATTNRPEDIDTKLRRGGRLEKEIEVTITRYDRYHILHTLLSQALQGFIREKLLQMEDIKMAAELVVDKLGGYVAADITLLVREISTLFIQQITSYIQQLISSTQNVHVDHPNDSILSPISQSLPPNTSTTSSTSSSSSLSSWIKNCQQILKECISQAMTIVVPSVLRGNGIKVPMLTFDDVIGCEEAKVSLKRLLSFADPLKCRKILKMGLQFPGGIILHGPPGNSKTRLLLAAASVYGLSVISLSTADVYSPYVGDAEAEIRKAFRLARQSAPCILFMDEIDALVTNRGVGGGSGSGSDSVSAESRVLATLLNELDGVMNHATNSYINTTQMDEDEDITATMNSHVFVFATTNRLDSIDAALLRKGRFHHIIHIPQPNVQERIQLVQYFGQKFSLSPDELQDLYQEVSNNTNDMTEDFLMQSFSQISIDQNVKPITTNNTNTNNTNTRAITAIGSVSCGTNKQVTWSGAEIENLCREKAIHKIRAIITSSQTS